MSLEQTPRILAPHLQAFQHKLVRMLGKVLQLRGDTAVIDAGGNVDVILNRVRHKTSYTTVTSTKCGGKVFEEEANQMHDEAHLLRDGNDLYLI